MEDTNIEDIQQGFVSLASVFGGMDGCVCFKSLLYFYHNGLFVNLEMQCQIKKD